MFVLKTLAIILLVADTVYGGPVIQQVEEFPEVLCKGSWWMYDCTFEDLNTTQENPRFKPYYYEPKDIQEVIVGGTQMQVLTRDICDYFPWPRKINIRAGVNLLEIADDAFENCDNLDEFIVRENKLVRFQAGLFKGTPSLSTLIIEKNPLVSIDPDAFNSTGYLADVTIKGTQLEDLPYEDMFRFNGSMSFVVYSNNLKDFPIEMLLERTSRLRYVGFNDNDIPCWRVQEIFDVLAENPSVSIYYNTFNKPRESEVSQINGVTCIP